MDKKFVQRILTENINELKINAFAMIKSRDSRVREVARQFFECYSKNHICIARVAQNRRMKISIKGEPEGCSLLEGLQAASPDIFDQVYTQTVARRQREVISLAKAELQEGRDPELKEVAAALLRQLEHHLEAVIAVIKAQAC